MKTMTVKLKTVTPLFLGGARTTGTGNRESIEADIRVPPIKSALRFWFRFAEGARSSGDWKSVKAEEDRLFGSSESGVGAFRMRLAGKPPKITSLCQIPVDYKEWLLPLMYMGYGCLSHRYLNGEEKARRRAARPKKPTTVFEPSRSFIDVDQSLEFQITFGRYAKDGDDQKICESLWLWTHLGGLGSRSRRGWGSLALESLSMDLAPKPIVHRNELEDKLKGGITKIVGKTLPTSAEFTHWFSKAKIKVPYIGKNWHDAMTWMGDKFIDYRSNFSRKKKGPPRLGKYPCWSDHDLVKNYLLQNGRGYVKPPGAPMRTPFGLPHNYGYSSLRHQNPYQSSVMAQIPAKGDKKPVEIDRRASPLLIHLHKVTQGVAVVITFVPSKFLPNTAKIIYKPTFDNKKVISHKPAIVPVPQPSNWTIIDQFLRTL